MSRTKELYSKSFEEHGATAKGVGWLDTDVQRRRFHILMEGNQFGISSILDVGCGYGELVEFLKRTKSQWFNHIRYTGIDIVPEMIDVARARYQWVGSNAFLNTREFYEVDIRDWVSEDRHPNNEIDTYDLVLCSGGLTFHDMPEKLAMLDAMWCLTGKTLAFNIRDQEATPRDISMLMTRFETRNWMARHDYGLEDTTVVVKR